MINRDAILLDVVTFSAAAISLITMAEYNIFVISSDHQSCPCLVEQDTSSNLTKSTLVWAFVLAHPQAGDHQFYRVRATAKVFLFVFSGFQQTLVVPQIPGPTPNQQHYPMLYSRPLHPFLAAALSGLSLLLYLSRLFLLLL